MSRRYFWLFTGLWTIILMSLILSISTGTANLSIQDIMKYLLMDNQHETGFKMVTLYRIPAALTGFTAGAALGLAGMLLQSVFKNPLADGAVLGVSSGGILMAAVSMLVVAEPGWSLYLFTFSGCIAILFLLLFLQRFLTGTTTILLAGVLIGYGCSAVVSILEVFSTNEKLRYFILWGMGSFTTSGYKEIFVMFLAVTMSWILLLPSFKNMNLMLMGELTAQAMGVKIARLRIINIAISGVLIAVVTTYCGPISFIGLTAPFVVRMLYPFSGYLSHSVLVLLVGGLLAVWADIISRFPGLSGSVPVNAVLSFFGIPVMLWTIINSRKK